MPAWWKGKAKSKSTSSSSANGINKEKGDIFNGVLILGKGKSLDRSPVHAGPGSPCAGPTSLLAHPLPRPSSSPLPRISPEQVAAATSASTSGSSVSSSGSDEAPDLRWVDLLYLICFFCFCYLVVVIICSSRFSVYGD